MFRVISRNITVFFLVIVLLINNFNTLFIFGNFLANQSYIAKVLCIQKENQLGCNGKCYLAKQISLSHEQQSDKEIPSERKLVLDVFYLTSNSSNPKEQISTADTQLSIKMYKNNYVQSSYLDIETPPPNC